LDETKGSGQEGDEGFEIELDEKARAVCVRAWGFWSSELASRFAQSVIDACRVGQGATALVMDARGLKPQRESGQEAFGLLIAALPGLGIVRASVTTDSSLTRLQLLRITKERAVKNLVEFTHVVL
jgi:hypothetical protein